MKTVNVNIDSQLSTSTYFIFRAKDTLPTKELFIRYSNINENQVTEIENKFLKNKYTVGSENNMYELTRVEHNVNYIKNSMFKTKTKKTILKTTIEGSVVKTEDDILFSHLPQFSLALFNILKDDKEKRVRVTIEEIPK